MLGSDRGRLTGKCQSKHTFHSHHHICHVWVAPKTCDFAGTRRLAHDSDQSVCGTHPSSVPHTTPSPLSLLLCYCKTHDVPCHTGVLRPMASVRMVVMLRGLLQRQQRWLRSTWTRPCLRDVWDPQQCLESMDVHKAAAISANMRTVVWATMLSVRARASMPGGHVNKVAGAYGGGCCLHARAGAWVSSW